MEATAQCPADSRGLLGMDGATPDLQNIRLDIQIQSPDGEAAIQELLRLWRERCPIYPTAIYGGAAWVFVLLMIVTMPTVTPWVKKRLKA